MSTMKFMKVSIVVVSIASCLSLLLAWQVVHVRGSQSVAMRTQAADELHKAQKELATLQAGQVVASERLREQKERARLAHEQLTSVKKEKRAIELELEKAEDELRLAKKRLREVEGS